MKFPHLSVLLSCGVALAASPVWAADAFALRDGDRVVLVGNTLIEREQRYGYWETALTRCYPDKSITFRNLGWSGDTVFGDIDGVVVIPQAVADEVFSQALEKVTRENRTRDELREGKLLAEVYEKYGVL